MQFDKSLQLNITSYNVICYQQIFFHFHMGIIVFLEIFERVYF